MRKLWKLWNDRFEEFSEWCSDLIGAPIAFIIAIWLVLAWAISGPLFQFSDTWQLIINTGTTVLTFLMLFVLQASQNADARAVQQKLDKIMGESVDVGNELVGHKTKGSDD